MQPQKRNVLVKPVIVAVAALAMSLAACGSEARSGDTSLPSATSPPPTSAGTGSTAGTPATTPASTPAGTGATSGGSTAPEGSASMSSGPIDPGLGPYVDIAVADLAQRLGVDAGQITVESATLKQWPDSSLGCPQPGMQYAQVLTDGALIVLAADGKTYKYHAGGSRPPFYCEGSKATASG